MSTTHLGHENYHCWRLCTLFSIDQIHYMLLNKNNYWLVNVGNFQILFTDFNTHCIWNDCCIIFVLLRSHNRAISNEKVSKYPHSVVSTNIIDILITKADEEKQELYHNLEHYEATKPLRYLKYKLIDLQVILDRGYILYSSLYSLL